MPSKKKPGATPAKSARPARTKKPAAPVLVPLTAEERETTLATIRDLRTAMAITANAIRERAEMVKAKGERGSVPGLDPQTAMAMSAYAKTIRELLEMHPDLKAFIDGDRPDVDGDGPIGGPAAAGRLRNALGASEPS